MPPAINARLRTLVRINRALKRGITPHMLEVVKAHGHYDRGIDAQCVHDFGLLPSDVRHLEADTTPAQRERIRASVVRALWAGWPGRRIAWMGDHYRAAGDPFPAY